jgi:4-oxalocrotonate tautomerase
MPLLQMTLIEGRSADVKRALIAELTDTVVRVTGAPRESVRVILNEVPAAHWGVGGRPKNDPPSTPPARSQT